MHEKKAAHFLSPYIYWLAGINATLAEECTETERNLYRALGWLTPIPAILSFISIGYYTASQGYPLLALLLAPMAGAFVLLIDRALIATYNALEPVGTRRTKLAVRIFLGVALGIVVTHPLLLWSFRDAIRDRYIHEQAAYERELQKAKEDSVAAVFADYAQQKDKLDREVKELDAHIAKLVDSRVATVKGKAEHVLASQRQKVDSTKAELDSIGTELSALRNAKRVAEQNLNSNRLWLSQEGQFGLNERDDNLSGAELSDAAAGRNPLKRPRSKGFSYGIAPSDPLAEAPDEWKRKCPRMMTFWSAIQSNTKEVNSLELRMKPLMGQQSTLMADYQAASAQLRDLESRAIADAEKTIGAEVDGELASFKSRRDELRNKLAALANANVKSDAEKRAESYTVRLNSLTERIKSVKAGGPIDTMQQTQSLIDEVLNPMHSVHAVSNSWGRRLASLYEVLKFFLLFLALDMIPIVIKCLAGPTTIDHMKMGHGTFGGGGFGGI